MKVRAQIAMVLNLDKCIGCHTCSVTRKNVWTSRDGMEYAWFNNVETNPASVIPRSGRTSKSGTAAGSATGMARSRKQGGKWRILANIFANPDLPAIDDYHEPWDYDYAHLQNAPESKAMPTARPRSRHQRRTDAENPLGPNWRNPRHRIRQALQGHQLRERAEGDLRRVRNTFMMYLPRLCEHRLNPACVASCPSGAIYKREEDGIVLIDQDKCRGWRMCVSGCPYKKIYYNWNTGKSEKCILCYPASSPVNRRCVRKPASGASVIWRVALRCRQDRAGGQRRRRAEFVSGATRSIPRSVQPNGANRGASSGHSRTVVCRRPRTRRSTRWPSTGRSPSRCIPSIAPCRWSGTCRRCRRFRLAPSPPDRHEWHHPRCRFAADSAEISGQPADRWRRKPVKRALGGCWPCAPTCVQKTVDGEIREDVLQASTYASIRWNRCIATSPSPIMRIASSFRPATVIRQRHL